MPEEKYEQTEISDTDWDGSDLDELTTMPGGLPPLAKASAVKRLADALETRGHSEGASRAIARAVVRPEEARRRLQSPDITRVTGGVLETVSVQVWTAGVTSFPGNNREASQRIYPLSGAAPGGQYPSLGPVSASPGVTGELVLNAESPAHVVSGFSVHRAARPAKRSGSHDRRARHPARPDARGRAHRARRHDPALLGRGRQ